MRGLNLTNWGKIFDDKIGFRTAYKSLQVSRKGNVGVSNRWSGTLLIDGGTKLGIGKNAQIINNGSLEMGLKPNAFHPSSRPCMLDIGQDSKLIINGNVNIGRGVSIVILKNACLELGHNVYINSNTQIVSQESIKIGDNVKISWDVEICDTDFHRIIREGSVTASPIEIGNNILVGRRSMIMKGVKIGDGSVIAAGAIVTRTVPAKCLVAGIPGRVIKQNIQWE